MVEGVCVCVWLGNDLSGVEFGLIWKECGMWLVGDDDVVGILEGMFVFFSLEWVMCISLLVRIFYFFEVWFLFLREWFLKRKNISNDLDFSDVKMVVVLVDCMVMLWLLLVLFVEWLELEVMLLVEEIKVKGLNWLDIW